MEQLKTGFYSRTEIAAVLEINLSDSKHFKRNITNKLLNWGYSFEYSLKGVKITRVPTTPREKLAEIALREFDLDIRVDTYAFSAFIYSFLNYPEFTSMPWKERELQLKLNFGVQVSDRTLRNWSYYLINTLNMYKDYTDRTRWITSLVNGVKVREMVDGDPCLEKIADEYEQEKQQLLDSYKELEPKAKWKKVLFILWIKYNCYVYYCYSFKSAKVCNESAGDLIRLVNDILLEENIEEVEIIKQKIL